MIRGFVSDNGRLKLVEDVLAQLDRVIWVDLVNPTDDEEVALEQGLGIEVPTREEMAEIEISSRLYYENGAAFMTATLPAQVDSDDPQMAPVTFVLAGERLVTIRYHEPRAFQTFPTRAEKVAMGCTSGETILVSLLEAIVDRLADILERAGEGIDRTSHGVFQQRGTKPTRSQDFQKVLEQIGREGDLTSDIRHGLMTLERLLGFLGHVTTQHKSSKDIRDRLKTLARDVRSLTDHASFLSQKITFLLDATLGMINIEQNAIIKIFSVAAVVFLPPTLVASIYGMNFVKMPELDWMLGYPFAICLMIGSAILPYLYFKRRGWL
jgi:magnesium transporter